MTTIERLIVAEAELKAAQKAEGEAAKKAAGRWNADYLKSASRARLKAWNKAYSLRKAAGVDPCRPYGTKPNPDLLNIRAK